MTREGALDPPFNKLEEWAAWSSEMGQKSRVIPHPETQRGLNELLETLDIPGIDIVVIAMSDATRILTGSKTPNFGDVIGDDRAHCTA